MAGSRAPGSRAGILHAKLQPLHAARGGGRRRSWSSSWRRPGARFTHHTSIAPTGTISLSLANNASNGIEPSFAHHYFRNVIRGRQEVQGEGRRLLLRAAGLPRAGESEGAMPGSTSGGEKLPDYFIAADDVTPKAARGHPGRGAEVGRLVDLQDRQCADRFPLREVQGHLSLRPRAGAEGLHHVPLQSGGVPGRAGEGAGPEEHHLHVHARGRHGRRGARR